MSKYLYEFLRKDTTFDTVAFIYGFTLPQRNLKNLLINPYACLIGGTIVGCLSQVLGSLIYWQLPSSLRPIVTILIISSTFHKIMCLKNESKIETDIENNGELNINIIF
jgi:hypothetical protein